MNITQLSKVFLVSTLCACLFSCGGGGSGSKDPEPIVEPPVELPPPPPPTNPDLELPQTLTIEVPRPDGASKGNVTLELTRFSIRDANFFEVYVDEQTYSSSAHSSGADIEHFSKIDTADLPVRTYRGTVKEQPNSAVVAIVWPGDNSISIMVSEGKRVLWTIDDLEIDISDPETVSVTSPTSSFAYLSKLNTLKSWDWVPSFNTTPTDLVSVSYAENLDRTIAHGWPLTPKVEEGIVQVQLAVDGEPEWFKNKAGSDLELALAIIEYNVNILDHVYVRDLSLSHVLTGYVQRSDTNLHKTSKDTIKTWTDNGLGLNPGSTNSAVGKSIPFQQLIWAYNENINPNAYRSKKPLDGGNYAMVPLSKSNADGTSHEVGHNWGGSHFVYPRDSMSGGGPWFGPTTAQTMLFLKERYSVGLFLPKISKAQYAWNVHPYATPDLVRIDVNETTLVNVLGNDYDGNGDAIGIAKYDVVSKNGGRISQQGQQLKYIPKTGFQGRDSFSYLVTDGEFTNDAWVQIDVGGDLLLEYKFESLQSQVKDTSGSNLNGNYVNFNGLQQLNTGIAGNGLEFPWLMTVNDANLPDDKSLDSVRPFIDFGDVVDPMNGDHSVSMWVKFDSKSITSGMPVYLIANSSSVINTLVSGYTIYTDKNGGAIHFEVREQLSKNSTAEQPLRKISYQPSGGLAADQWYQVTLVIDRSVDKVFAYVNGQAVSVGVDLTKDSYIKGKPAGGRYISAGMGVNTYKYRKYGPFAGVMDEVSIYARALSATEVTEAWNANN